MCFSREQQVKLFFAEKKDQKILCQIDFLISVSLGPKWKNPASGVPSLMAADKPCPQLQPSLTRTPFSMSFFSVFCLSLYKSALLLLRNYQRINLMHYQF